MQETSHDQRQQAANRLMIHLMQKGRPAPYKERLIDGFANPIPGRMPEALTPIDGHSPLGFLQRLVFAFEAMIRRGADPEQTANRRTEKEKSIFLPGTN